MPKTPVSEKEFDGLVWIVERNHEPLVVDGRVVSFPCGGEGTTALRAYLNTLPTGGKDYYDGYLYQRRGVRS